MRKIYICLNCWRTIIAIALIESLPANYKEKIYREVLYWGKLKRIGQKGKYSTLAFLLFWGEAYRNLLYYRIGVCSRLKKHIFKLFFPIMDTLFINVDELGECLYIQHGFSTIISAKKIGDYCWINQQVTIGWKDSTGCPVSIGNGVKVACGAKVLGPITIGDNAIIGANAVITKNVDKNAIIGGVPGKVIGENHNYLYRQN